MSTTPIAPIPPVDVTPLYFRGLFSVLRAVPFYMADRDSFHFKCEVHLHDTDYVCQDVHVIVSRRGRLRGGNTYSATGVMLGHKWRGMPTIKLRGITMHQPYLLAPPLPPLPALMSVVGHGSVIAINSQRLGSFNDPIENTLVTVAHEHNDTTYEVVYYALSVDFSQIFPNVEIGGIVAFAGSVDGYKSGAGRWIIKLRTE